MKTEFTIDGRTLALSANAATPIRYRMTFGSDLMTQITSFTRDSSQYSDTISQMAYIMAKSAAEELNNLSFENYLTWLEQFDDPMTFVNISSDIINFYLKNVKTESKAKNPKGPRTAK